MFLRLFLYSRPCRGRLTIMPLLQNHYFICTTIFQWIRDGAELIVTTTVHVGLRLITLFVTKGVFSIHQLPFHEKKDSVPSSIILKFYLRGARRIQHCPKVNCVQKKTPTLVFCITLPDSQAFYQISSTVKPVVKPIIYKRVNMTSE